MGNCFKTSGNDDISLLRGSDNHDSALQPVPFVEPPPPYRAQVSQKCHFLRKYIHLINVIYYIVYQNGIKKLHRFKFQ